MTKEEWRDVVGYEGLYKVSTLGRVRSITRKVKCKAGSMRQSRGKLISYHVDNRGKGYLIVGLRKNGEQKLKKVHRLVAMAFIPNPYNKAEVNHKDGDPKNCHVSNLEWVTNKENNEHAKVTRLVRSGENHPFATLTNADIKYIRRKYANREMTQVDLAEKFKVLQGSISNIVCYRSRKELP